MSHSGDKGFEFDFRLVGFERRAPGTVPREYLGEAVLGETVQ